MCWSVPKSSRGIALSNSCAARVDDRVQRETYQESGAATPETTRVRRDHEYVTALRYIRLEESASPFRVHDTTQRHHRRLEAAGSVESGSVRRPHDGGHELIANLLPHVVLTVIAGCDDDGHLQLGDHHRELPAVSAGLVRLVAPRAD